MKIQPINAEAQALREPLRADSTKPVLKSRFRRFFDLQLPSVLKSSSTEKPATVDEAPNVKDGGVTGTEFEPSSVCLANMVQNFIEDNSERLSAVKCGRSRCNCFNPNIDSSDDEFDMFGGFSDSINGGSTGDSFDFLKSLIQCPSVAERNLLADTAMIVDKNKSIKRKDEMRKVVTDGLSNMGYNSSICKSQWEKSFTLPAGEYEYIDVIVEGEERLLIDIDFRSEFEIARSTAAYKATLQSLPYIFVGKTERLGQIISIVSEAAKLSLKKKGMHFPPWRKADYMRAKWLSPFTRAHTPCPEKKGDNGEETGDCGELELLFGEETEPYECDVGVGVGPWQPPAVKQKRAERGVKMVTGLASLFKEKP